MFQGVKIHASCRQSLMPKLETLFRVGEWIVVTNFALVIAFGLYRTTSHVYKMVFRNETTITDSSLHCDNMFLDLYDFENMLNGSHDTRFLIDVMGEVLDLGVLKNVQNARNEVNKVEFTLRDIKDNRIHCCIMGRSAHILADDAHKLNNGDICLIRFAKLQNLYGKIQVSNAFDCSLVLLNPSIEEARALNRRVNTAVICTIYAIDTMSGCVLKVSSRFKLNLLVQDLTGESKFSLLDSEATYIVKSSAAKVLNGCLDENEMKDILPSAIVDIVGKTYGFGISVDDNNGSLGTQFNTIKVWNLNDIMWKRIKSLHQMSTSSRKK
ncbi:uncharacterized protein LOC108850720 [Raphanus sativus]|uniref:Uncharacterized protein LOC108850720 n=1 Tax=Raphanus sativus TaxID=3726 RepID=A0A6J0N5F1_RAPSA|nr:uncharacterized protein LOC108850720 [Raphanus sativus]